MTGSHVGQGKMTGTIVVEESLPVVVIQILVEILEAVKSSRDTPEGTVVMVEVIVAGGSVVTGPTVSVVPPVVIVSTPVIVEPGGRVRTVVEPSGPVSV